MNIILRSQSLRVYVIYRLYADIFNTKTNKMHTVLFIENINPYSAGIDFSRQNLTSVDVRFWRLKSTPAL